MKKSHWWTVLFLWMFKSGSRLRMWRNLHLKEIKKVKALPTLEPYWLMMVFETPRNGEKPCETARNTIGIACVVHKKAFWNTRSTIQAPQITKLNTFPGFMLDWTEIVSPGFHSFSHRNTGFRSVWWCDNRFGGLWWLPVVRRGGIYCILGCFDGFLSVSWCFENNPQPVRFSLTTLLISLTCCEYRVGIWR